MLQASRTGDAAIMDALLKAGADPSLAHPEGETPLMAASRSGMSMLSVFCLSAKSM